MQSCRGLLINLNAFLVCLTHPTLYFSSTSQQSKLQKISARTCSRCNFSLMTAFITFSQNFGSLVPLQMHSYLFSPVELQQWSYRNMISHWLTLYQTLLGIRSDWFIEFSEINYLLAYGYIYTDSINSVRTYGYMAVYHNENEISSN